MTTRWITSILLAMTLAVLPFVPARAATGFTADLAGANEVPPTMSQAMGTATFALSPDGTSIGYTIVVTNLTDAFASHIHIAPLGMNGPVAVPLFSGTKPGAFTGTLATGTITAGMFTGPLLGMPLSSLIAEIEAGRAYVQVHTTANPGGDIRGQLVTVTLP